MHPIAPRSHRFAVLLLLPLLLAGCGAGGGDTTSAAEPTTAAAATSSEPIGDAVPGMGRTAEASETANPDDGRCAEASPEPLREVISALEPIEAEPDYGPGAFSCELSYPQEYIESTITDRGLDRTGYEMASGGFGVRMIISDPDPDATFPPLPVETLTSDEGRLVRAIENPDYGQDYIIKDYWVTTDQHRLVHFIVAVFASDTGGVAGLDQAVMDSMDEVSARI